MTQFNDPRGPDYQVNVGVGTRPIDRIRWSAVLAGLVTALAIMVVLSVFGTAVGLTAYDPGDDARAFGWGFGIWAIISAIIAFFLGGWIAARTAAVTGHRNGLMNGAMVWATTFALALFFAGVAGSNAMSMLGSVSASRDNSQPILATDIATGEIQRQAGTGMTERAAERGASAAWWTLVSLLVGLGAAAAGGWAGARDRDYGDRDRTANLDRPTTPAL